MHLSDWNLTYFDTGEWQVIEEHLQDLKTAGVMVNPPRVQMFRALKETPLASVKVAIFGQDPYPDPKYATGIAFSIPKDTKPFPPTLETIFQEYVDDLHYPYPTSGDLTPWVKQGVLLWNVVPTTNAYISLGHRHWNEYWPLTEEIIKKLEAKGDVVFVCLGSVAKDFFNKYAWGKESSSYFMLSHPSPRVNPKIRNPFLGSRMFSRINALLREPVDWRLL